MKMIDSLIDILLHDAYMRLLRQLARNEPGLLRRRSKESLEGQPIELLNELMYFPHVPWLGYCMFGGTDHFFGGGDGQACIAGVIIETRLFRLFPKSFRRCGLGIPGERGFSEQFGNDRHGSRGKRALYYSLGFLHELQTSSSLAPW
jgi:hypothetical protein